MNGYLYLFGGVASGMTLNLLIRSNRRHWRTQLVTLSFPFLESCLAFLGAFLVALAPGSIFEIDSVSVLSLGRNLSRLGCRKVHRVADVVNFWRE